MSVDERFENTGSIPVGEFALEQALRRAHCASSAKRTSLMHRCVGILSVLPDRVVLSCKLCGTERVNCSNNCDDEAVADSVLKLAKRALTP